MGEKPLLKDEVIIINRWRMKEGAGEKNYDCKKNR
jgi:hypothetical protein